MTVTEETRKRRENHKRRGWCTECKNPPVPGKNFCAVCAAKYIANGRRWRNNNLEYDLWLKARRRAKKHNFPFTIEEVDIVIPKLCPVLSIPLFYNPGSRQHPNSPSLDRIDSKQGYIKGNIRVISWRANELRKDGTRVEFEALAHDAQELETGAVYCAE